MVGNDNVGRLNIAVGNLMFVGQCAYGAGQSSKQPNCVMDRHRWSATTADVFHILRQRDALHPRHRDDDAALPDFPFNHAGKRIILESLKDPELLLGGRSMWPNLDEKEISSRPLTRIERQVSLAKGAADPFQQIVFSPPKAFPSDKWMPPSTDGNGIGGIIGTVM
jgi:hypothetical protein